MEFSRVLTGIAIDRDARSSDFAVSPEPFLGARRSVPDLYVGRGIQMRLVVASYAEKLGRESEHFSFSQEISDHMLICVHSGRNKFTARLEEADLPESRKALA